VKIINFRQLLIYDRGRSIILKKISKEQKGFAFIITILCLALMSILGFAIIGVTTSNFKMAKVDSRSQSSYYIAEAGANYMVDKINTEVEKNGSKYKTNSEFFQNIENNFTKNIDTLDSFEENNGQQPKAFITVSHVSTDEDTRDYRIESIGEIGNSKRKVSTTISIGWTKQENNEIIDSLLFYSKKFIFKGSSVNAVSGSIVMDGLEEHNLNGGSALNITNMYFNGPVKMDGGSASFGSKDKPGNIYVNGDLDFWNGTRDVYGDIRVKGKFRLKDAKIHGDVYVDGDLELGWTPQIDKNIYYTGKLIAPANYNNSLLNKCIKVDGVDSFEIPMVDFSLKEDSWYSSNGYVIKGNETGVIPHNAKMLVNNYKNTNWQNVTGQVVIVSKGDIILRGGNGFTGALIAPNGRVEYSGDGTFNGVIISKNEINLPKGGNHFNFKSLKEVFGDDIPVITSSIGGGSDGNNSGTNNAKVTIKTNIKEE